MLVWCVWEEKQTGVQEPSRVRREGGGVQERERQRRENCKREGKIGARDKKERQGSCGGDEDIW